jgi:hypothetical protein
LPDFSVRGGWVLAMKMPGGRNADFACGEEISAARLMRGWNFLRKLVF